MDADIVVAGGGMGGTALQEVRLTPNGAVCGARALTNGATVDVRAPAVILATGGFQGNLALRQRYMGRWANGIVLRANSYRTGDSLQAAIGAGNPIHGRFVAGADAGGIYTHGYTGGLALSLAFGHIAGTNAATLRQHAVTKARMPLAAAAEAARWRWLLQRRHRRVVLPRARPSP